MVRRFFFQILPYFIEIFRVSPLLISYVFYHNFGGDDYLTFGVFCFFLLLLLLTVIALIPTGSANPSRVERMARFQYAFFIVTNSNLMFASKGFTLVEEGQPLEYLFEGITIPVCARFFEILPYIVRTPLLMVICMSATLAFKMGMVNKRRERLLLARLGTKKKNFIIFCCSILK